MSRRAGKKQKEKNDNSFKTGQVECERSGLLKTSLGKRIIVRANVY
jgi:hypothetical protein